MTLTDEHAAYLAKHAVSLELAERLGVRSVAKQTDLPDEWRAGLGRYTPGIVFPWTAYDGRISPQLRPDNPRTNDDGDPVKYEFQRDADPVLWAVRPNPQAKKVLFCEGSKQCLVAAEYAPADYAVFGIAGCWGYSQNTLPIRDLKVAKGRDVIVIFDADAGKNLDVYTAGERLAKALKMKGARSVKWVQLPVGGTKGLDDLLKDCDPEDRADDLAGLIDGASVKIAERRPSKPKRSIKIDPGRPEVQIDDDPLAQINAITAALLRKWDGHTLFRHGGVLSLFDEGTMHPLDQHSFNDLVMKTVTPVVVVGNEKRYSAPSSLVLGAVQVARAREFTPLDRLTNVPFVRQDGSVCVKPGYDEQSQTILVDSEDLQRVKVSEQPTHDEIRESVTLLLDDWFGDMPFPDQASRANALALVLTYFVRGLVPIVPLAVIDGLQMSSGKGLLADCISIVALGQTLVPKGFNESDDENRKATLAAFRAGEPALCWDEAHNLHGTNLARLLTAATYADRILGVSTEAKFPNRMVFTALGNQVKTQGDIQRRVYPIQLHPTVENPQDRDVSLYHHQDLPGWTKEHRSELMSACLTLVRAWFAADRTQVPNIPINFGSFEAWQRIVGGVLAFAEVPGFLGNRETWRKENNYESQHWSAHIGWLVKTFDGIAFTAKDVKTQAMQSLAEYEAPPGNRMSDVVSPDYTRLLGQHYDKRKNTLTDGWKFLKHEIVAHGGARRYQLVTSDDDQSQDGVSSGDKGVNGDTPPTPRVAKPICTGTDEKGRVFTGEGAGEVSPLTPLSPGGLVIFDLETGSATELHSAGPEWLRLGGWSDGATTELTTDFAALAQRVQHAHVVTGHNVMGFDLIALARHYGLDVLELTRRGAVFDTLLAARFVDPPMAREKGVDAQRRYDLDSLGRKYELGGKSGDLKGLKKEFGGFDQIPVDDPRYREYLTGDVALSLALYRKLHEECGDSVYLRREHRVAAIAAQMTMNGFRVNRELLDERLAHNARLRDRCLERLHEKYDIPLNDEDGQPYSAPLATKAGKAALIEALQKLGVTSWWTTGKTSDIATGKDAMAHLSAQNHHLHDVRELCLLVAKVVTLRTVYTTVQSNLVDDRVHPNVTFRQSTGRWSLTKPGLTVFGKRGGKWHEREVFIAEPDHVIIAVDLSQIDMRAIAGLSGDAAYVEMLSHEDPHAEIARVLFGDASMREVAKPIGHGWNYGRGVKAISNDNDLPPDVVLTFDKEMRARFPRLVAWQDEVRDIAGSGELLDNGFGRKMRPDPTRAHTQGPALMGQGAARDLMMTGLLRLPEYILPMLRGQVHDEVVLSVPAADAEEIQRVVIESLSFDWEAPSGAVVPIRAEGGPTDRTSWGQVYAK